MIFRSSSFGRRCENADFGEGFVLGDSDYTFTPYLIAPFNNPSTPAQVSYIMVLYEKWR